MPHKDRDGASEVSNVGARIAAELPYLRRYARALTGDQATGDRYAAAALEALLAEPALLAEGNAPRLVLFRAFHVVWRSSGAPVAEAPERRLERRAQAHLNALTPNAREALLLFTIEEFSYAEIGWIMRISAEEAAALVAAAYRETEQSVSGEILVIEDEPLIALDIRMILEEMGHRAVGVARTAAEAVALGRAARPELILADVQLADGSSGAEAVKLLLEDLGEIPVIFITAFPERLLTGEKPEPAFLIAKPFTHEQLRSAVSQAMFFASTETLTK